MYEFGPFRADTARGVLWRGDSPVPLTGKCFEILIVLVKNAPETVSKDDLMKAVWADTFVEESNLTQHVSLLRKRLGETPQERLYIATVPGRGYRFVAAVKEVEETADDDATGDAGPSPNQVDKELATDRNSSSSGQHESAGLFRDSITQTTKTGNHWKPLLAIALAAGVLLAGAAYRWVHRGRATPVLGTRDSVLLADFDNQTGEPVFDGPLREGIAIQLGQSPFLELVAPDSVRETLKYMGRSPDESVRLPLAREVCERVGAKALISGSIARLGDAYVIGVETVGCADGTVLAREQLEARNKEEVLRVLGKVTAKLRESLGESLTSLQTFDVPMEQATTRSLEALKSYSLGVDERSRGREKMAIPFFEHAISLDPDFAMAYAQLGAAYRNLGLSEQAQDRFEKAFALRENLSEREKLHLTVRYLETVKGDLDKAIDTYEIWTRMYPRDPQPFNGLSARYQVIGQYEKAAEAAREAISLAQNYYAPYDNLARSYLALNRFDEATQACQKAAEAGRDSLGTHRVLLYIAWINRDRVAVQHELEWARGTEHENDMLASEASMLIASGKLRAGRMLLERTWATSRSAGLEEEAAYSRAEQALAEADLGNYQRARSESAAALKSGHGIDPEETAAEALALSGDVHRAQTLVEELRGRFPQHSVLIHASLPSTLAAIQLQRQDPGNAIDVLQQALPFDLAEFSDLSPIYVRGLAYLRAKSGKEAASEFQKILDHPGINVTSQRHPLARLGLARADALMGDGKESRKNYEEFFALWADADTDIPVLREARQEYRKLQ